MEPASEEADTTAENMAPYEEEVEEEEEEEGDQPVWAKPVLATPATHYLLITSSLTGAQF